MKWLERSRVAKIDAYLYAASISGGLQIPDFPVYALNDWNSKGQSVVVVIYDCWDKVYVRVPSARRQIPEPAFQKRHFVVFRDLVTAEWFRIKGAKMACDLYLKWFGEGIDKKDIKPNRRQPKFETADN